MAVVDGRRARQAALAEVEALERDGRLAGYRYLPATKADLLHRLGRDAEAVDAYQAALGAQRQRGRAGVPGGAARIRPAGN